MSSLLDRIGGFFGDVLETAENVTGDVLQFRSSENLLEFQRDEANREFAREQAIFANTFNPQNRGGTALSNGNLMMLLLVGAAVFIAVKR